MSVSSETEATSMLKYLAALALVPAISFAAPAPDPYFGGAPKPIQKIMLAYWTANDNCRGTTPIGLYNPQCDRRAALFTKIEARGWCWNLTGTDEAEATWGKCKPNHRGWYQQELEALTKDAAAIAALP